MEATSKVCAYSLGIDLEAEWQAQVLQVAARLDRRECPWFSSEHADQGLPVWRGQGRRVRGIDALALWISRPQHSFVGWSVTPIRAAGCALALWWHRGRLLPTYVVATPDLKDRKFLTPPSDDAIQYTIDRHIRAVTIDIGLDIESPTGQVLRELTWIFVGALIRKVNHRKTNIRLATMGALDIARLSSLAHIIADDCIVSLCGPQIRRQAEHWVWPILESADWGMPDRVSIELDAFLKTVPGEVGERLDPVQRWAGGGVRQFAAKGLRLTSQARTPFEAWFAIGRLLASQMRDLVPEPWTASEVAEVTWPEEARVRWRALLRWYKRHAWTHLWQKLVQQDIAGDPRFDRRRLAIQLKGRGRQHTPALKYPQLPLNLLPLNKVGRVLAAPSNQGAEEYVLSLLEAASDQQALVPSTPEARWTQLLVKISKESYRLEYRRKAAGGVRTIEVPSTKLAAAQRVLARALAGSFPRTDAAMAFLAHRSPVLHALSHAGAQYAVVLDVENFFGSIRPHHVEYAFRSRTDTCLSEWSKSGQDAALEILFSRDSLGSSRHLPQGAPSSPIAANLAAMRMDGQIFAALAGTLRDAGCVYTRYADDLVVSTSMESPSPRFFERVEEIMTLAIHKQGWRVAAGKTRRWSRSSGPLTIGGIHVPASLDGTGGASRELVRRGRSARHRLSTSSAGIIDAERVQARGLAAYLAAITAHPGWLAWISPRLGKFARALAGPLYARALLEGWDASLDRDPDAQ